MRHSRRIAPRPTGPGLGSNIRASMILKAPDLGRDHANKQIPGRARFHIRDCDLSASTDLLNVSQYCLWPNIESVPSLRICHSQSDWNLIKKHNLIPNGGFK